MNDSEREILQKNLLQFIVKDVFKTITDKDLIRIGKDKVWYWRDSKLSSEQIESLKAEAAAFEKSFLWRVLKSELIHHASKMVLENGTSEVDLRMAQLMGYLTKVIDDKLKTLST